MSIQVKFNPELALRPANTLGLKKEECIPENLEENQTYTALKKGQRNLFFDGEVSLRKYNGKDLSKPIASIKIIEVKHFKDETGQIWSEVKYLVKKIINSEDPPYFNGFEPLNEETNPEEVT